jgi:hypothetical protein
MLREGYLNHEMGTVVQFWFKDQTLMTCFSLYVGYYSFYCSWAIHRSTSVLVTRTIGCWTVPPVTVGCVVSYLFRGWYVWVWKFMFSWVGNWLTPFSLFWLHELSPWPNSLLSSCSPWFPRGCKQFFIFIVFIDICYLWIEYNVHLVYMCCIYCIFMFFYFKKCLHVFVFFSGLE